MVAIVADFTAQNELDSLCGWCNWSIGFGAGRALVAIVSARLVVLVATPLRVAPRRAWYVDANKNRVRSVTFIIRVFLKRAAPQSRIYRCFIVPSTVIHFPRPCFIKPLVILHPSW